MTHVLPSLKLYKKSQCYLTLDFAIVYNFWLLHVTSQSFFSFSSVIVIYIFISVLFTDE